ncbi:MAG TPA: Uma2 family endonuclease, partial [Verrucomicrobiota bacterium]|nr:Uma2 family endonuclease [Verrucomicrobiota bacterium]
MSSILDDPAVRRQVFPVSVEFYHQAAALGMLGEDVELLDGIIVKKMAKSPLHTLLVALLEALLRPCLPPHTSLRKEEPLTLADSAPEPDLAVVTGEFRDFAEAHPATALLVIEVAVTTEERDRRKAAIYARAGVAEYWLIEPDQRRLTVFRLPQE